LISGKFKNYQSLIAYFEVLPKEFTPNHFWLYSITPSSI
jgi:hypothetical protein